MRRPRPLPARPALLVAAMAAPVLLLAGLSLAQNNARPSPKPPTARQKFKNIKVLKDLPADQLLPVMHEWNTALGVKCDFCHVVETDAAGQHVGWERDDKAHKGIARQMVTMTRDINTRYKAVHKEVTCFTCHRGHAEPEKAPAPPP